MREAFAGRHAEIALVIFGCGTAPGKTSTARLGSAQSTSSFSMPCFVIVDQLLQAQPHAAKRFVVRRQHQNVGRQTIAFSLRAGIEPVLQRIGVGLGRKHD